MELPPKPIIAAVVILSVSLLLGAISWVEMVNWRTGFSFAVILVVVSILIYFLRALYRGRDGARWALVVTVLIALFGAFNHGPPYDPLWEQTRFWMQNVAYVAATVLVFLPASNAWFRRNKPPKSESKSPPIDY